MVQAETTIRQTDGVEQLSVVKMKTRKASRTGHLDDTILGLVGVWKLARSELRLTWADYDYRFRFYTIEDAESCTFGDQFAQIGSAEGHLAQCQPRTTLGCQHILEAVVDILQERQRDPDHTLANGPVIELILNVIRALEYRDIKISA